MNMIKFNNEINGHQRYRLSNNKSTDCPVDGSIETANKNKNNAFGKQ